MQPARNALSLLAVACGLSASACSGAGSPLQISDFLAVTTGTTGGGASCTATTSIVQTALFTGGSGVVFLGGLEVTNQMQEPRDLGTDPTRVPQLDMYLDTVSTTFKFVPDDGRGSVTLKPETHTVFVSVKTQDASKFPAELLGSDNGTLLLQRSGSLFVTVTVSGHTLEGTRVTSPPAVFPVQVSSGSPPCPDGKALDVGNSCNPSQAGAYVCK